MFTGDSFTIQKGVNVNKVLGLIKKKRSEGTDIQTKKIELGSGSISDRGLSRRT